MTLSISYLIFDASPPNLVKVAHLLVWRTRLSRTLGGLTKSRREFYANRQLRVLIYRIGYLQVHFAYLLYYSETFLKSGN